MQPCRTIWTVGHSNHDLRWFLEIVRAEGVEFLLDVRSYPYSRFAPQFNRDDLQAALHGSGVRYLFMGLELGGRPQREEHYDAEGHARYAAMAADGGFQDAVARVLCGARDHRLALLCSCGRPDECHRRLLVGKVLCEHGAELRHILPDGKVVVERSVQMPSADRQTMLFGHDASQQWRSTRSVSRRRRLSVSSVASQGPASGDSSMSA